MRGVCVCACALERKEKHNKRTMGRLPSFRRSFADRWMTLGIVLLCMVIGSVWANPDAKRLYDDLLSNYNRLIRPVSNNTDTVLVKLGLRLSQLIDLVSSFR